MTARKIAYDILQNNNNNNNKINQFVWLLLAEFDQISINGMSVGTGVCQ